MKPLKVNELIMFTTGDGYDNTHYGLFTVIKEITEEVIQQACRDIADDEFSTLRIIYFLHIEGYIKNLSYTLVYLGEAIDNTTGEFVESGEQ